MMMQIPTPDEYNASHAVLLEVLNVLGIYSDGMVVIGGWVPELMFPGRGHIGSMDVDLAVDGRTVKPSAYGSIRQRLIDAGYTQTVRHAGVFTRKLPGGIGAVTVKLDLVTGEENPPASNDDRLLVQDLNLGRLRGVDLAFNHAVSMTLKGTMPDNAENTVRARVVDVPAFQCLKAFALNERMKQKDAYDVYFCLKHFEGGPSALARAAAHLLAVPRGREALDILRIKFESVRSVGPQWAALVASGQGDEPETVARDAYERAAVFFATLDS